MEHVSYRVSQQVLDVKFLVKISNLREIRIFKFFGQKIRQIEVKSEVKVCLHFRLQI